MEFLKKLFNFSDTISGTDFVIRWIASLIIQYPGGFLLGMGLASSNMGLMTLGLLLAMVGIVLQFSTLMKRSRALFSNKLHVLYFYIGYVLISIFQGFAANISLLVNLVTALVMLSMFGYAIFKNSGTPPAEHLG